MKTATLCFTFHGVPVTMRISEARLQEVSNHETVREMQLVLIREALKPEPLTGAFRSDLDFTQFSD